MVWCTCVHSEDIMILNLSHRGQQSLPIPWTSKMASSVKKTMFRTEWTKCVSKCVSTNGLVALSNKHKFKPRSNTARKYWSPTKLFVIRKIFWMYLYRNCLQRYSKCVAFLELNGIKKKVVQSLSDSCREFSVPKFAQSAKSSRRSSETRDWRKFSFMWWEYKKCSSGKKHRFFILFLLNW